MKAEYRKWKDKQYRKEYHRQYYLKNKERMRAQHERYKQEHLDELHQYQKEYRERPESKVLNSKRHREWYLRNAKKIALRNRRREDAIRELVFGHYGNGVVACVGCGESRIDCLSLDHINDDGAQHRRGSGKTGGIAFYWLLKTQGLPLGLQTMCMNCQMVKERRRRRRLSKFHDIEEVQSE